MPWQPPHAAALVPPPAALASCATPTWWDLPASRSTDQREELSLWSFARVGSWQAVAKKMQSRAAATASGGTRVRRSPASAPRSRRPAVLSLAACIQYLSTLSPALRAVHAFHTPPHHRPNLPHPPSPPLTPCCCAGRDLHSALQVRAAGSQERLFSWGRRGKRVALDVAKVSCCWDWRAAYGDCTTRGHTQLMLSTLLPYTQAMNFLHQNNVVHMDSE